MKNYIEVPHEITKRGAEVDKLIETLQKNGDLQGKVGQFVLYNKKCELIKIVPQEKLQQAIIENDDFEGYAKIKFE